MTDRDTSNDAFGVDNDTTTAAAPPSQWITPRCNRRVKILEASNITSLEDKINQFIATLPLEGLIDIKIGRGDFTSAMILYYNEEVV